MTGELERLLGVCSRNIEAQQQWAKWNALGAICRSKALHATSPLYFLLLIQARWVYFFLNKILMMTGGTTVARYNRRGFIGMLINWSVMIDCCCCYWFTWRSARHFRRTDMPDLAARMPCRSIRFHTVAMTRQNSPNRARRTCATIKRYRCR